MMIHNWVLSGLLIGATLCCAQNPPPLACNLKAFTPEERKLHHSQTEAVMSAVVSRRELPDGYVFQFNAKRVSLVDVAEWVALERKCCPFFDYEMDVQGERGPVSLALKGGPGVKEFIQQEFRDRVPVPIGPTSTR